MTLTNARNLNDYLNRIGITGPQPPDARTLRRIQLAHLRNVPFEALDIVPLGRPISLDLKALHDKVVQQRRGGFCYELNGLLAVMLEDLGFIVTRGCGYWHHEDGSINPPFDHLVLAVQVPGDHTRWLVDVGGGRSAALAPLRLLPDQVQHQSEDGRSYRLRHDGGQQWRVMQLSDTAGNERVVYDLDLTPRQLPDFADRCLELQHDPASDFRRGILCTRALPDGRVTVASGRLIITRDGERTGTVLATPTAEAEAIREWFGIDLPALQATQGRK